MCGVFTYIERETMRNKFLNTVLSSEGYYCLFTAKPSENKLKQYFFESIQDLCVKADESNTQGYDAYFALATFEEKGSRKVTNIKNLRSFFLDLDCGEGKEFASKEQAIKQLQTFCQKYKLPTPRLIDSGRGIHVYWFLTEDVSYDKWLPVAEQLKTLCSINNFKADPAVTADGARILRIPNTHNYKTDPALPVIVLGLKSEFTAVDIEDFTKLLFVDGMKPVTKALQVPLEHNSTMLALMGNQENYFKDILVRTQNGNGCDQLANILYNQKDISEPLWRAGLSIAKFCTDGEKAIHKLSCGHPEYSANETNKKVELIKGPYACTKFDEFNLGVCQNCPNWGKIKSPISLGKRLKEAEIDSEGNYIEEQKETVVVAPSLTLPNNPIGSYTIPKYPNPYIRGANGGVYIRTKDDDGEIVEECLYHNDIYVVKRVRDAEAGESAVMRLHLPMDGVREFTLPMSAITSKEEFRKALAAEGVAITRMDKLMTYTINWVNELQNVSKASDAHRHFGWVDENMDGFILGNQLITADSIEFNPPSNATVSLFPAFEPRGTLEAWKKTISFWEDEKFVLQQFGLGMGFGSPLMEFTNVNCGTVCFHSKDSGLGKTAIQIAQVGIWGDPEELLMTKGDTQNFRMNRSEVYHSLPVAIDEITNMSPQHLSELVYQNTSGQQKGRMSASSNVERKRTGRRWSLLCSMTSNTSIVERISMAKAMPKAEAQRVLECKVERLFDKHENKPETDKFEEDIMQYYGTAGVAYIQHVMKNKEACRKIVKDTQKKIDIDAKLTSENRFWSATVSATLSGLIIAKKAGLHNYDVNKIYNWAVKVLLESNKSSANQMNNTVFDIMNDFFTENISYILQIKSDTDNRSQQGNGLDNLVIPEQVARGKLIARYETDTKLFFVKPKELKQWCGELQINYAHLLSEIKEHCEGKNKKVRLAKGTHLQLPPSNVIVMRFDLDEDDKENKGV